jgi:Zn-dependent protease
LDANIIQQITIYAIPVIFAITLHEAAHAFAAKYFGDSTAYMLGRMTLNPVKHIDPVWTILVPLVLKIMNSPFIIGAAKPVPVNFSALKNPKRDMIWVAAAGPAANFLMVGIWALIAVLLGPQQLGGGLEFVFLVCIAGIEVNVVFAVINLFPLPPLDGGRIVTGMLPGPLAYKFSRLEPYGMFILIALIVSTILPRLLLPPVAMITNFIYGIIGLS